jgi:tRNA(fMet)-specific endonuclease VapC
MLDTNIVSHFMRQPRGAVATRIEAIGKEAVFTSVIVAAELRFGISRSGSAALARRLEETLEALLVVPLEKPADAAYAEIRTYLERQGTPIGSNDLLIAAHAKALGTTLVTANTREFSRVPGLTIEDWTRA